MWIAAKESAKFPSSTIDFSQLNPNSAVTRLEIVHVNWLPDTIIKKGHEQNDLYT